ncbi:MAG: hypothetical protein HOV68_12370 [Streptomycetaceae bacterium]|nr:hypothetical protein [Streptomycetaceae bacterium]
MTLVPTSDDTWGDFARPATGPPADPPVVEIHTFGHRVAGADGSVVQPRVHATFGPRAVLVDAAGTVQATVAWSDTRGIHKDPIHRAVLGPKGHVPEEFLHLGPARAGEVVRVRTELLLDSPVDGFLAVGAAAAKSVRLAAVRVPLDDGGHLATGPVRLPAGRHLLELDLTPDRDLDLRAHIALVRDAGRYLRPEWIRPAASDEVAAGGGVVRTTVQVSAPITRAVVQVATRGSCVLRVNGRVAGRQGGFDPYTEHAVARVRRYDVAELLRIGDNELTVEIAPGGDPAVLVDAVFDTVVDGRALRTTAHSGAHWWAESAVGSERASAAVRREPDGDPAALHLTRRPHPLPGAAWLDPEADDGTVVPVGFAVPGEQPGDEWLTWQLPPGTRRFTARVYGDAVVYVDGREQPAVVRHADHGVRVIEVDLAGAGPTPVRDAALRVTATPGRRGGALLAGPVRCEVGTGLIRPGDWEERGLADYSGGVRYRMSVPAAAREAGRVRLDLGRVRGTAEVRVGDTSAGVRVCSPYKFDLTGLLGRDRDDRIDITVFGTLASRFDATSPTHFVFPGQKVTGLFGPVRLHLGG